MISGDPGAANPVPIDDADVPSPCTNVCSIDPATGWCAGCMRTLAEIGAWSTATPAHKRAILAALAARR